MQVDPAPKSTPKATDRFLDRQVFPFWPALTVERLLIFLIILLTVISRFYDLGARVMAHDEINHVVPSYTISTYIYDPVTHGVRPASPTLIGNNWHQAWEVYPLPAEDVEANQAAAAQALQQSIVDATQQRLDDFARTRNYDGILSACTYATSAVPRFAAEGQYAVQARDATWAALYQFMADVQAGTRPVPTGFADIEPDLPALEWPQ